MLLVWGAGAIASGLVTTFSALIAARVVIGLAEGALFPTITVLIANWFPHREHARAMGLAILSLPVASVIMSPIGGWLIQQWDYHVMFIAMAVPALVLAVVVTTMLADSPAQDRRLQESERSYLLSQLTPAREETADQSLLKVLATPSTLILGLIYFLWQAGIYAFILWLPSVISQASHDGIGIVGLLAAIPFVFGAVALYTTARLADRAPEPQMRYIAGPLVLSGVALIVQHFVSAGLWINITLLCVCALGIFAPFGPWWAWVLRMAPRNQVGSAGGVVNAIGNLGGIVGPIVVGAAATGGDLRNGFYVLGVALLLAAGIAVWLNGICRDRPAREASSAATAVAATR